jgi:hypothetical protein
LKAVMTRVLPFVVTDERALPASRWLDSPRLASPRPITQLELFETAESAQSGEM